MKRVVEYEWRLVELMAARGMYNTTELVPLLAERDIELSRTQTFRLGEPWRRCSSRSTPQTCC